MLKVNMNSKYNNKLKKGMINKIKLIYMSKKYIVQDRSMSH